MELMEIIKKRYSVRNYSPQTLKRELISQCLEAARLAPSACNSQPWEFIIVDNRELKGKLCEAMLSGVYGLNTFIKDAPVLVVVVADKAKWLAKVCNFVRDTRLYLIDIGIACDHFVLKARELGIGTCILGWFNEKAVKKLLGVPQSKRIDIIIAMGYPADGFQEKEKNRKKLSEMSVYYDG
jgi:nitroreductase